MRPAHGAREEACALPDAHQPEAAVLRRAEHRPRRAQPAEGARNMARPEARNVAADQQGGERHAGERPVHAPADIAPALPDAPEPAGPGAARPVRRHRQHHPPAPVGGQPAHRLRRHAPVEGGGARRPDIGPEPGLDRAQPRLAQHHHHRPAPHAGGPHAGASEAGLPHAHISFGLVSGALANPATPGSAPLSSPRPPSRGPSPTSDAAAAGGEQAPPSRLLQEPRLDPGSGAGVTESGHAV